MPKPSLPSELKPSTLSVPLSIHMSAMMADRRTLRAVKDAYPEIERILLQIQKDVVNEENRDNVGPDMLALKRVQDVFLAFKAKADHDLSTEQQNQ